jgi:putative molybdopterin biosynthesis protein
MHYGLEMICLLAYDRNRFGMEASTKMSDEQSYTTDDIAKLLKISKLTVYELIKKGNLPAYRVGKQMRVDAADLDLYKANAKSSSASAKAGAIFAQPQQHAVLPDTQGVQGGQGMRSIVITGQDASLDILAKHLEKRSPRVRPLRSYVGSMDSLVSLYRGEADIVSTHLWDGDTDEYNLPFIRKLLIGHSYIVMNLVSRRAGLYVRRGNPKQLQGWEDLSQSGIKLVNREKGSGARVLLDEQLRIRGIDPRRINGYGDEQAHHMGVAGKVSAGEADVGVGIEKAAAFVGVDFVPLTEERYDLVMLKTVQNREWIGQVKHILQSDLFKNELRSLQGYGLSKTGKVLLET